METRRHNEYGVDLTGTPENLNRAMRALNTYDQLFAACDELLCCPAFNGAVFDKDKASHRVWTIAHILMSDIKQGRV